MDPIASLQGDFLDWILRGYAPQDDDGAGALRGGERPLEGEESDEVRTRGMPPPFWV